MASETADFLAEAQRRGIGEMGAADFDDLVPGGGFFCERVVEFFQSRGQIVFDRHGDGDVNGRGEHVVGRLPHVHVVVGMDRLGLRTKRSPPMISMARLAITSLAFMLLEVPEPVWKMSSGNSLSNLPSATSRQACSSASTCFSLSGFLPEPVSLPRSRLATAAAYFTKPEGVNQFRRQRLAGDGKVFDGALGLGAVIGLGGNADIAHRVVFGAEVGHWM